MENKKVELVVAEKEISLQRVEIMFDVMKKLKVVIEDVEINDEPEEEVTEVENDDDADDELADEYIIVDEFKFAEELLKFATAKSNANENGEKYVADVKYFYKKVMELAQKAGYKFVARVG